MRTKVGIGFVLACALMARTARAQDATSGPTAAKGTKSPPSDKEIIDTVGDRMSKVFAKFGYPQDVFATTTESNKPAVFLDFGSYGLEVYNKAVDCCMFFSDWKGTVLGVKMGDSQDSVIKTLGKPDMSDKGTDGLLYMTWPIKQWEGSFEVDFDKDNKVKRVIVIAE